PALVAPVLLGAFWAILAVALLALFCFREYARATGLFREKLVSLVTGLCIVAAHLAVLDNWHLLFVALFPLALATVAAVAVVQDRPKGYIQRVALGWVGFALFGSCLGPLGSRANDTNSRPLLLLVLTAVAVNDVAAFTAGRLLGGPRLCPNTSPHKTVAGAAGGL